MQQITNINRFHKKKEEKIMLLPSLFGENLLDNFFDVPAFSRMNNFGASAQNIMRTDVKENEKDYEISMNLPGFKKEDVKGEIKNGYLTISASTSSSEDTKDDEGKYIRKERYSGSCSRSFYVGEQITQEDIRAKFEDGVLKITVPKPETKPAVEEGHYIAIEG